MQAAASEGSATLQESKDMRGRGRSDDERNTKILAAQRSRNSFHLRRVFMSRGVAMNSWTWEVTENIETKPKWLYFRLIHLTPSSVWLHITPLVTSRVVVHNHVSINHSTVYEIEMIIYVWLYIIKFMAPT